MALVIPPPAGADADTWTWSLNGLVDTRARSAEDNESLLVPEPERVGHRQTFMSVTGVTGMEAWNGPIAVAGAGRMHARTAPGQEERAVRLHVDELHAEYAVTPEHFLYAGRRHIVHGRSLGMNPLDVAIDPLDLDRSKGTARRRSEIEGQDMVGFESLLGDRFALSGYWTPGERTLLAGTFTIPERKLDFTALVLDDERPGAGLSFSRTLGEAVLTYADVAIRRGRDRSTIRPDPESNAGPGTFVAEEGDGSGLFAQSSIGTGYTLESGANFNLEYHFDSNGYTNREWDAITGLIAENDTAREQRHFGELPTGNLLALNARLRKFTLRRHYGFLRARHPTLLGGKFGAEMNVLHNLGDHSGSMGWRLERETHENVLVGVEARCLYGDDLDEFGLRAATLSGSVYATLHF